LWEEENKNVGSHDIGINEFEEHLRKLHAPSRCMIMISSQIKTKTVRLYLSVHTMVDQLINITLLMA